MRPTSSRPAAAALLALALAACSSAPVGSPGPSATPAGSPAPSPATGDPTTLVLREDFAGGFIGGYAELTNLPVVSIYADGSVILVDDPAAADAAIPALRVARLTAAGLEAVVAAARAAGLDAPNAQLDGGPAADLPLARFTFVLDGRRHVITASRLDNPAGADAAAISKLATFAATLTEAGLGASPATIGAWAAYAPASLRLLVLSHEAVPGEPAAVEWPLATPLAEFGDVIPSGGAGINTGGGGVVTRCGAVSGADLAALLPVLGTATTTTTWDSGGSLFTLVARPLLPDESGCL